MEDEQLPVVAIGSAGDVTRVNAPARRILQADFGSRDVSLGALVALLLQREPQSRGVVSLSLGHESRELRPAALSVVLNIQGGAGAHVTQGTSTRSSLTERRGLHDPDGCPVCRLRSPLDTIQRVARGLRSDESLQHNVDVARELELLEVEAQRASLIVESSLGPAPTASPASGRLGNRAAEAVASGSADAGRSTKYGLTQREVDVLQHIIEGKTDRGIARSLGISTYTVNKHVANILGKMAAPSRTAAGVRAIREGIVV
jgi:DNA-binding CsgD family transcriptional regulator